MDVVVEIAKNPLFAATSADSGPEKPENPNFENETRQTRTRTFVE